MAETHAPRNQWGEIDETPTIGQWHVRHSIPAARDTGYLFGKNFATVAEALEFCAKQEGQCRLLTHVEGDGWLWVNQPFQSYFIPGAEPAPAVSPTDLADRVCHEEQMVTWSSEVAESLAMGGWLRGHLDGQQLILARFISSLRDDARALDARAAMFRPEFDACWEREEDGRLGQMLNQERAMQLREAVLDGPREAKQNRELADAIAALLPAPGMDAEGQDAERLGAEHDSPIGVAEAPQPDPTPKTGK